MRDCLEVSFSEVLVIRDYCNDTYQLELLRMELEYLRCV